MKPDYNESRYEVIQPYPHGHYKVGDLLEKNYDGNWHLTKVLDPEDGSYTDCFFAEDTVKFMPNLFRLLAWYERRTPDEMPQWVKAGDGEVFKVDEYHANGWAYSTDSRLHIYILETLAPATREEYEKYMEGRR